MKRKQHALFLFICLLIVSCKDAPQTEVQPTINQLSPTDLAYQAFLQSVAKQHIAVRYNELLQRASAFERSILEQCSQSSTHGWLDVQQHWKQLNASWQALQWLRSTALEDKNIPSRFQYWPDANGAVLRGTQRLLHSEDSLTLSTLSKMNVGAQGLPAAEYLLFSDDVSDVGSFAKRCEILTVISENLTSMSKYRLSLWQQNTKQYQGFISGTGAYADVKDAFEEIYSEWLTQLTLIKDNKLLFPMGIGIPGIPQLTESPYANVSGENIRANLIALKSALTSGQGIFSIEQAKVGNQHISDRILIVLNEAISITADLSSPYNQVLATEQGRTQIMALIDTLSTLQTLMAEELVISLELNLGFNSLDGD